MELLLIRQIYRLQLAHVLSKARHFVREFWAIGLDATPRIRIDN